jgi:hypothetical protein
MKRITIVFSLFLVACSDSGSTSPEVTETSVASANVIPSAEAIDTAKVEVSPKTDAEVIVDGLLTAIGDAVENKRRRDSIMEANKSKWFAYKIGFEKTDREDVFDTYEKLKQLEISGLYALQSARKEYVLICYEAKAEAELKAQLDSFKLKVAAIEPHVELVNIMNFCSLKEVIKKGKNLTKRKKDFEIPCLECDK